MRIEDLNTTGLVEFDSKDGVLRIAGRRALIIDATAKVSLRKEPSATAGQATVRAMRTSSIAISSGDRMKSM